MHRKNGGFEKMKSLDTVQKIAKVIHIICQVLFVCAIVGAAGALIGALALFMLPILGERVVELIVSEVNVETAVQLAVGLIAESIFLCGQIVAMGYVLRYLKNELADGTPFTARGAGELLKVGIISLAVPAGALAVSAIVVAIGNAQDVISNNYDMLGGIIMILMSFVFRYGAELEEKNNNAE